MDGQEVKDVIELDLKAKTEVLNALGYVYSSEVRNTTSK